MAKMHFQHTIFPPESDKPHLALIPSFILPPACLSKQSTCGCPDSLNNCQPLQGWVSAVEMQDGQWTIHGPPDSVKRFEDYMQQRCPKKSTSHEQPHKKTRAKKKSVKIQGKRARPVRTACEAPSGQHWKPSATSQSCIDPAIEFVNESREHRESREAIEKLCAGLNVTTLRRVLRVWRNAMRNDWPKTIEYPTGIKSIQHDDACKVVLALLYLHQSSYKEYLTRVSPRAQSWSKHLQGLLTAEEFSKDNIGSSERTDFASMMEASKVREELPSECRIVEVDSAVPGQLASSTDSATHQALGKRKRSRADEDDRSGDEATDGTMVCPETPQSQAHAVDKGEQVQQEYPFDFPDDDAIDDDDKSSVQQPIHFDL